MAEKTPLLALPKWHRSDGLEQRLRAQQPSTRHDAAREAANLALHPGLRFDRFLPAQNDDEVRAGFLQSFASISVVGGGPYATYIAHVKHLRGVLESRGATLNEWRTRGRLLFGAGDESVLEFGVRLGRTYGFPVIPGSALKGLVKRFAAKHMAASKVAKLLFGEGGDKGGAGLVAFHDAVWFAKGGDKYPFAEDVVTVHHPDYYQQDKAPVDWDSPNPITMLSVQGWFLFALEGEPEAVAFCTAALAGALSEWGVGAKTSKGYGRFETGAPRFAERDLGPMEAVRAFESSGKQGDHLETAATPPEDERRETLRNAGEAPGDDAPRSKPVTLPSAGEVQEANGSLQVQKSSGRIIVRVQVGQQHLLASIDPNQWRVFGSRPDRDRAIAQCKMAGSMGARITFEVRGSQMHVTQIVPKFRD